ncbi:hypothetical protein HBJ00_22530, partial [Aeromonas veronii]
QRLAQVVLRFGRVAIAILGRGDQLDGLAIAQRQRHRLIFSIFVWVTRIIVLDRAVLGQADVAVSIHRQAEHQLALGIAQPAFDRAGARVGEQQHRITTGYVHH